MFQICIDPYWGASLSNIALNLRKSHINHVVFLPATFASSSLRKKKHLSFITFSRFTHLSATIITSQCIALSAIAARQKSFTSPTAAYEQHFRHTHCLFLLFLRTSNIKNCPKVILNVLILYRHLLRHFP